MRTFIIIFYAIATTHLFAQTAEKQKDFSTSNDNYRIVRSLYYENSETPKFVYDYKYDKDGLLLSITKKRFKNKEWVPTESKEFKYDSKAKSIYISKIRGGKLKRDADTLKIENGKVNYWAQFREGPYRDILYHYIYSYENGNLSKVKKDLVPFDKNESDEINFVYANDKINYILQKKGSFVRKWVLDWNNEALININIYDLSNAEPKLVENYIIKSQNNRIAKASDYLIRDSISKTETQNWTFTFDNNANLVKTHMMDDTGGDLNEYIYEPGSGNAAIFEEKIFVFDYLKPEIK